MGRVAIITGAAGGIGAAASRALAGAGYQLVLADLDDERLGQVATDLGSTEVVTMAADVTDETAVTAVANTAVQRFGGVHVLVNVVGGGLAGRTADTLSREEWDAVLALSLTSTFLGCRAVLPLMEKDRSGSIVNVASVAGTRGMHESPAYCAAKGGIIALTRALALDHGPNGVRVNCVAPGAVRTPLLRRSRSEEDIAGLGRGSIIGRVAEPEEIAAAIAWLASDAASYVMGQTIEVDGGLPTYA